MIHDESIFGGAWSKCKPRHKLIAVLRTQTKSDKQRGTSQPALLMAIIRCRECGDKVSTDAAACPHCGAPQRTVPPTIPRAPMPTARPNVKRGLGPFGIVVLVLSLTLFAMFVVATFVAGYFRPGQTVGSPSATPVPRRTTTDASQRPWKVMARQGIMRFVYVPDEKLADRNYVAQILNVIMREEIGQDSQLRWKGTIEIMFFDDRNNTPLAFPMTDQQMLHWRARYNFNQQTGFQEFVWVTIVDGTASPPQFAEKKDSIIPGSAY